MAELPPPPLVSDLPLLNPHRQQTIISLAWRRRIPVLAVGRLQSAVTQATLAALAPDVALVSCFSQKIPAALLQLPPHGFLNLHPAALPAFRGPTPLFWVFRQGLAETAVTLHYMNEALDAGDVIWSEPAALPDGMPGPAAERRCAEKGGELMVRAVRRLEAGQRLPRQPQRGAARYWPWPDNGDFQIEAATWSARRAFNFMRGTALWARPYKIVVGGERLVVRTAVSYQPGGELEKAMVVDGREALIQFQPGVLRVRL